MEDYGSRTEGMRKEVTCADCGHMYRIAQGQRGSVCSACGNIEFHGDGEAGTSRVSDQPIAARRVSSESEEGAGRRSSFQAVPDGREVEDLRVRYQVEWQLWAALVKSFHSPAYHMAYLSAAIAADELDRAGARYREHRSVMALLPDSRWQAEVADLMLERVQAIAAARITLLRGASRVKAPFWLMTLPHNSFAVRMAWLSVGAFIAVRLLSIR